MDEFQHARDMAKKALEKKELKKNAEPIKRVRRKTSEIEAIPLASFEEVQVKSPKKKKTTDTSETLSAVNKEASSEEAVPVIEEKKAPVARKRAPRKPTQSE